MTLGAESQGTTIYGATVSSLQKSDVTVTKNADGNGTITGTLKYFDTAGQIVNYWGAGNFLAFKISNEDSDTTKTLVGLEPSAGSGLVDIHGDADMNGIAKITDPTTQKFVVKQSDAAGHTNVQYFDLSGLVCETE